MYGSNEKQRQKVYAQTGGAIAYKNQNPEA